MDREEAIRILYDGKWWQWCDIPSAEDDDDSAAFHKALDMAISAIRAQHPPAKLDRIRPRRSRSRAEKEGGGRQ